MLKVPLALKVIECKYDKQQDALIAASDMARVNHLHLVGYVASYEKRLVGPPEIHGLYIREMNQLAAWLLPLSCAGN